MATESIEVSGVIPATPQAIYDGFLNSKIHTAMTGGKATIASQEVGGHFQAWGGYITGSHLALEPTTKIVQSWRTLDFSESDADSRVEIHLSLADGGTLVTFRHSNIPEEQGKNYLSGWQERYLTPMHAYFSKEG